MKTKKIFQALAMIGSSFIIVSNITFYNSTNTVVEYALKFVSLFSYILFASIVSLNIKYDGNSDLRKNFRRIIVIFSIISILLNYLIQTNSIFINSLLISLIAFAPAFFCTYLFKKQEKIRERKNYLLINQYKTDDPFYLLKKNGNMLLIKIVAPFDFIIEEFDNNYRRVPSGYKFNSKNNKFMKNKKIIIQFDGIVWTLDENGNKL